MIAVVSHDAGGAEILSSWVSQNKGPFCFVLKGPAIDIFERKHGHIKNIELDDALNFSDWALLGSSWQSDLERTAINRFKNVKKKTVVFLDHWVNYHERFKTFDTFIYPDEIWVGDEEAEKIARQAFPNIDIFLKENPYFIDLKSEINIIHQSKKNKSKFHSLSVLYLSEPIAEHAGKVYSDERHWGFTEKDALIYFLKNFHVLGNISDIKIRPHPSEDSQKYIWARDFSPLVSEINTNKPLLDQIIESDIVIGCETMAMVLALMAEKRVVCSIPPGGIKCRLPQSNIESLQNLVTNYFEGLND